MNLIPYIAKLERKIKEYGSSDEIKLFFINDNKLWFDSEKRASLLNSAKSRLELGTKTITIWDKEDRFEIPCEEFITFLNKLEVYSSTCYDITKNHIVEIYKLDDIDKVFDYDYLSSYPERLHLKI